MKKTFQFASVLLILYLFSLLLADVNFAATKNQHLHFNQKQQLISIKDVNLLRQKALYWCELAYNNTKRQSGTSVRQIYVLAGVLILQLGAIATDRRKGLD